MPPRKLFLDTSFFIALENISDPYHEVALRLYAERRGYTATRDPEDSELWVPAAPEGIRRDGQ